MVPGPTRGAPERQNACFKADRRWGVVASRPMCTISGQSVKQSTMTRKSWPACEKKSTASSSNGREGFGLKVIGSRGFEGRWSWHCMHEDMTLSMSLSRPGQ